MSKKKSRNLAGKGFGKPPKPHKLIRQNGLVVMNRKDLLEVLRFVKERDTKGWRIRPEEEPVQKHRWTERIMKLRPIGHSRHNRQAVPVSVFHDPETDEAFYSPLTMDEFELVHGMRHLDKDGNIIKSVDAPKFQYAYTPFNTFFFDLDKLDELEEMLPYHEPTLDELIYLGQMDERHTPLNQEELNGVIAEALNGCGGDWNKFSRLYQMGETEEGKQAIAMEIQVGTEGETLYQPQKTRFAWSKNLLSVPIYPNADRSAVRISPCGTAGLLTDAL